MQEKNSDGQKQGGLSWSTPASSPAPAQKPVQAQQKPAASKTSVAAAGQGSTVRYAGMIAVGIVAGVIIAWGWSALRSPSGTGTQQAQNNTGAMMATTSDSSSTAPGADMAAGPSLASDPGLTIMSPQPAGNSVAVAKAIVSSPTWIVIYENKDGKPGNALGAALFFPDKQSGTVELLRSTMPGKTYLAVKQTDNGDRKFSLKDDQFLSEGGDVQWVTFETK